MKTVGETSYKLFLDTLANNMAVWWQYKEKAPTGEVEALVSVVADTDAMVTCNSEYTTEYL